MTIEGFTMLYGFKIESGDVSRLIKKGILQKSKNETTDKYKGLELLDVSYESCCTDFENNDTYFGATKVVLFDSFDHRPKIEKETLDLIKEIGSKLFPDKTLKYHLIPRDL
jgi:hypothetical protein